MTGVMGMARGRAALRDAVTDVRMAEPPRTLHLTLNVTIDESGPDPTVTSVMLMVTRDAKPAVLGSSLVRQVVRLNGDGWRIASRQIPSSWTLPTDHARRWHLRRWRLCPVGAASRCRWRTAVRCRGIVRSLRIGRARARGSTIPPGFAD